uniref:Myelin basic protein n=1 Tax=Gadus morhua TaxID=8049 RepID=A0A8C5B6I8_GADMO
MASASRKKKTPTLMDQIGTFFGGDKKRKSKGSFRGALSPAPQKSTAASPRKRGTENAVVTFFRTIVSLYDKTPRPTHTHTGFLSVTCLPELCFLCLTHHLCCTLTFQTLCRSNALPPGVPCPTQV